ncbi:aromatic amino acid lyase [Acetobacter sp. TBRC 12305]|uniref:Aromatic amino acid lyase n=1 Tax=Acetobacter garciniae TaxID=2817435 RepID=A0A939HQS4_9PROT|nr:aromatic amino acid lyase [Acetobacter garciniae]MBX0346097.1 aromatic amino acid lyase [Acetobacter garciniae]
MTPISLTGETLPLTQLIAIADGARVVLGADGIARLHAGERALNEALARGDGIYGTTSMVGAFKDNSVADDDRPKYALRLLRSHLLGTGAYLPRRMVRAAMAIRLNTLLTGHAGASLYLATALADLLNAGITPAVPEYGSIGCADVGLMSHIGATLLGEGMAFSADGGPALPSATVLARFGLCPMVPGPKDVMSVLSSNALGVAGVALATAELRHRLPLLLNVFVLAAAGFGAFTVPWETARLDGLENEARVARYLQGLARPGDWTSRRNLQDPLSFRCMPQIAGALVTALDRVEVTLAHSIAHADDNPILFGGRAMTSGASLPLALALDAQALVIALCHYARSTLGRILASCREDLSGLPCNLTLDPGRQVAFGAATKLAADLTTSILRESTPASLYQIPVANGFEDEASYLPSVSRALGLQASLLSPLVALEAMAARQAIHLSNARPTGSPGALLAELERHVPLLDDTIAVSDAVHGTEEVLARFSTRLATTASAELAFPPPSFQENAYA